MNVISDPRPDFFLGETGVAGGMSYRVQKGAKKEGDLLLELWNGERWVKVGMELGGMLADFHYQVEDHLYPRGQGFKGGQKYFEHLRLSVRNGWRFAGAVLASERSLSRIEPPPTLFDWEKEGVFK